MDTHSLTDSTSKPSQPKKKKKLVKDVSDMTEEEQLHVAMMASMGGDALSPINVGDDLDDTNLEAKPEGIIKYLFYLFFLTKNN